MKFLQFVLAAVMIFSVSTLTFTARGIKFAESTTPRIDEQILGEMDSSINLRHYLPFVHKTTFAARGGARIAWLEKADKHLKLMLDGQPVGEFDDIGDIRFSDDGKHVIILAQRAKQNVLLVDGNAVNPGAKSFGVPRFSSTGKLIYAEYTDKWHLKVDGQERFSFDFYPHAIVFTPDVESVAVAGDSKRGLLWAVNGERQPDFEILGKITLSRDGRHFAYAAANDSRGFLKNNSKGFLVIDGKQSIEHRGDTYSTLLSDVATNSTTQLNTGIRPFSARIHGVGDPVLSEDGKRIAYAVNQGKNTVAVMVDDQAGPSFDSVIGGPVFNGDASHFAYLAVSGNKIFELRDHQKIREFEFHDVNFFGPVAIANDLSRFAFVLGKGGPFFFNGTTHEARRRLVVDGTEQEESNCFGVFGLQFSENGRHIAYVQCTHVFLDGQMMKSYDTIIPESLGFIDGHTLGYITGDDHKFVRITVNLD